MVAFRVYYLRSMGGAKTQEDFFNFIFSKFDLKEEIFEVIHNLFFFPNFEFLKNKKILQK